MHALKLLSPALAAFLWSSLPLGAGAALVTVEFQGFVTVIDDDFDLLPEIAPAQGLAGSFFYDDSTTVSSNCAPRPELCQRYTFGQEAGLVFDFDGTQYSFLNSDAPETPLRIEFRTSGSYQVFWRGTSEPLPTGSETLTLNEISLTAIDYSAEDGLITGTELVVPDLDLADVAFIAFVLRREESPASFDPTRVPPFIPSSRLVSEMRTGLEFLDTPEPTAALLLLPLALFRSLRRHVS